MLSGPAATVVAALCALCFFMGWNAQGWRKQAQIEQIEARHARQNALQQAALRNMEQHFNEQMQNAMQEASAREQALRLDADSAAAAAARLRDRLQQLRGELARADAANPEAAALARAAAAADLLAECAAEYQQLAAQADRHASDAVTCRAAWPAPGTATDSAAH